MGQQTIEPRLCAIEVFVSAYSTKSVAPLSLPSFDTPAAAKQEYHPSIAQ
jgi:hypothetical protein